MLPFPPPRDLPDPGMEPASPALADRFFTTEPPVLFLIFYSVFIYHPLTNTQKLSPARGARKATSSVSCHR